MDRQGEEGHTRQTFLGTHCIGSNSQGGIFHLLVADGATSVVKGLLPQCGNFQTTSVAFTLGLRHGARQWVQILALDSRCPQPLASN